MTNLLDKHTRVIGIGRSACSHDIEGMYGRIVRVDEQDRRFPYKVEFAGIDFALWTGPKALKADPAHAVNPFKVGDKVRYRDSKYGREVRTVGALGDRRGQQLATAITYADGARGWDNVRSLELVETRATPAPAPVQAPKKGHIVMVLDANGFPQPAKRPVVHATYHAATVEAQRLSKLHLGERFAVFSHAGTARTVEETRTITDRITGFTLD